MNETEKQIEAVRKFANQVKNIGEALRQSPDWHYDGDVVIKAGEVIEKLLTTVESDFPSSKKRN